MLIEWPLILIGGLLGSSHCVGMCGSFAISVGLGGNNWRTNLVRQCVYSFGRICTYLLAGSIIGFSGIWLSHHLSSVMRFQSVVAIIAGLFLVFQGLRAAGVIPNRAILGKKSSCAAQSIFGTLLTAQPLSAVFVSGLLTGLLPCGLVYAYLSLAMGSGGVWQGVAVMGLFGLGTVPLMVTTGMGSSLLSFSARKKLLTIAAWCVVLTGTVTLYRAAATWNSPAEPNCPFCEANTQATVAR